MIQNKTRKASWEYDDLAQKIQVSPRQLAAKLVLRHLASKSNDSGESHHGYASIAAHCSIARRQVSPALKYLRNLGLVGWTTGKGGPKKQNTNRYALNLAVMRKIVRQQGVFHPETGKLVRVECVEDTGVECGERTGLVVKSSALNSTKPVQSSALNVKVECGQRTETTIEPPDKSNPKISIGCGGASSEKVQTADPFAAMREEVRKRRLGL
jgi:hypothetical protein